MSIHWEWLRGDFDNQLESKTFAALKIQLSDEVITRVYDRVAEGQRDTVKVPLYQLALSFAENWWTILYEPKKSEGGIGFGDARHSLDSYMKGFVFPALSVWSGGDDTIVFEHPGVATEHSSLEFLPRASDVSTMSREGVEQDLFELVQAVTERVRRKSSDDELRPRWERVCETLESDDEKEYCRAAGRLGIDPYDPDVDDISDFAAGISERLFSNVCEAAKYSELAAATEWVRQSLSRIKEFPAIDVAEFGVFPERDAQQKVWIHGYDAARTARRNLRLEGFRPRRVVDEMFGASVSTNGPSISGVHPLAIEAITDRVNGGARVAVPATSARSRRSRLCRAAYLAWRTPEGESSAVTTASTLDQQASRAFAAELLAPAELVFELAGNEGLTAEKIEDFARQNVCPEQTIIWQAYNHKVPLRGVSLPSYHRF